jgi:hypothetical protein
MSSAFVCVDVALEGEPDWEPGRLVLLSFFALRSLELEEVLEPILLFITVILLCPYGASNGFASRTN